MRHFIIHFISLVVSLLISLTVAAAETPYINLDKQASQTLLPIFNLESSTDMYVKVGYSGPQPSIAIITPVGVPCAYNQAKTIFEENMIIYEIPSAMEGQWYVHILSKDSDRLNISYDRLSELQNDSVPIFLWIVIPLAAIIVILCLCYFIPRIVEAKRTTDAK